MNARFADERSSRWVGLTGPTASGKSGVALMAAHRLPVEIVSVDSALVYRGMDIGTAKPTARQRAQIPHHLIDIVDPTDSYSAARFAQDAKRLIAEINARGRLPLLVGGTLLYYLALMQGLDAMPPSDPEVRAALNEEGRARGWPALHAELAQVDPVTAARLAPMDSQRIQRALEVWRLSGRPLSQFQSRHQGPEGQTPGASVARTEGLPPRAFISLEPHSREWLHGRIAERMDYMLDEGLIDEVRQLRARPELNVDLPSMRCVGYRQAWQALDEGLEGAALRSAVHERASAATRQLAKRQMTWLRSLPERTVVACDDPRGADAVVKLIAAHGDAA